MSDVCNWLIWRGFNLHISGFQNDVTTKDNDKDFTKGHEGLLCETFARLCGLYEKVRLGC